MRCMHALEHGIETLSEWTVLLCRAPGRMGALEFVFFKYFAFGPSFKLTFVLCVHYISSCCT